MYKLIVDDFEKLIEEIGEDSNKMSPQSYPILKRHCRPCIDSTFGGNMRPVRMLVSIRTDRTNEVIVPTDGKFYTDCTSAYPREHPLDDMILLAAQSLFNKVFDEGMTQNTNAILRTTVYPVGACVIDEQVYVYTHVVIDHTLKSEEYFHLTDSRFESIIDLKPTSALEEELIKKLIIVKGENENA